MLLTVLRRSLSIRPRHIQVCRSSSFKVDEEYTTTPQYPPILDLSFDAKQERKNESCYEEIKNVATVEEKQIKLNMPRYYGFKCYMMYENSAGYNTLPMMQHITRTHVIENNTLPTYYDNIDVDNLLDSMKSEIEEIILLEYDGYIRRDYVEKETKLTEKELEDTFSKSLIYQLNRFIMNMIHESESYIENLKVDYSPRIESFWYAGGIIPPDYVKKYRKNREWLKHLENDPFNRGIHGFSYPSLTLRSEVPLNPIISYKEAENPDFNVPVYEYDPKTLGVTTEHRRIVNVPGFWPGEKNEFGVLSFHQRGYLLNRTYGDEQESKDTLQRQAILASFNWLNAQANFLGFNSYNDITYPLVTQTCITNGQLWSFYVYQLNTMVLHSKYFNANPKKNVCWATKEMKLFDDIKDNQVHGLNLDVLKILLKFYLNKPEDRLGVSLRPYLTKNEKRVADYEDEEKRIWLEKEYKSLTSNRPNHKLGYEVYSWEKIYKIDHKTRVMEKRTRPFELFVNPYMRKLNDRQEPYVPKAMRPHLKKSHGRQAKSFFP